jgi:hypothetical protein
MPRIQIRLKKIQCHETEDVTGADEFYVVAAFKKNSTAQPSAVFKGIWSLNNGQSVSPDELLFDEAVDTYEEALFKIWCFDRDAAEKIKQADLEKAREMAGDLINKIQEHREANGRKPASDATLAGMAIDALIRLLFFFVSLDDDDLLGEHPESIPTPTWWQTVNPVGPSSASHDTQFKCLYDGCHYDVHYTVTVIY